MKMLLPDFTSPIIWIGLILISVYAYLGGKWLQRRYDDNKKKVDEEAEKDLDKYLKDLD